ncbi:MAG: 50S ribosomal protein L6 [Candidatus Pacebacteria bacterium]|nr:50S ribosomal protein L6 [Candidatus Paceibacterota bacterium]
MSRIGKRPITIPAKTEVTVADYVLTVKGPKGTLTKTLHPLVECEVAQHEVTIAPKNSSKLSRALWGTFASHVKNMLHGVNEEYKKKLILDGIGYRMAVTGSDITLALGFSHPVVMHIPAGLTAVVEKSELTISGIDKEAVGQFAANIRALKKPEPYKGKGFHYSDEIILRKQGKKASK